MRCAKCGNDLKPGAKFCTGCGTIAASEPTAAGVPPPSPPAPAHRNIPPVGVPMPPSTTAENEIWARQQPPSESIEPEPAIASSNYKNISLRAKIAIAIAAISLVSLAAILISKSMRSGDLPLSGTYKDASYNISLNFPANGWKLMSQPPRIPGEDSKLFFRGNSSSPDISMKVFNIELPATAPLVIPDQILNMMQKSYITKVEKIVADEDFVYTQRAFAPYPIGGGSGVWMEGDGKRGSELRRVMFFHAMRDRRSFYILFIFNGKDPEPLRAEAFKIIDSLKFL